MVALEEAAISGAMSGMASIGGSLLSGFSNKKASKKAWKRTLQLAQMQRNWELENYQNAHQWEAQDLKKAGMNPALTASNGTNIGSSGAGSLNFPSSGGADFGNLAQNVAGGINTLAQLESVKAQNEKARAEASNATANAIKTTEETKYIEPNAKQEIKESTSRMAVNAAQQAELEQNKKLAIEQTNAQMIKNQIDAIELAYQQGDYAKFMRYWKDLATNLKDTGIAIGTIGGTAKAKEVIELIKQFKKTNTYNMIERMTPKTPKKTSIKYSIKKH